MDLNVNDYITHKIRPDWGVGRVTKLLSTEKFVVNFKSAGIKKLIYNPEYISIETGISLPDISESNVSESTSNTRSSRQKNDIYPERNSPGKPLILKSKHSTKAKTSQTCYECRISKKGLWRYSKSNKGTVYLCDICKESVRRRSFGTLKDVDVMDTRFVSSGNFEGNRHRH